jgi:hypothetical protein
MFRTFISAYSCILLLHFIDVYLLQIEFLNLARYSAALFCGLTLWSILENMSSCNGATWAKICQKIMVDKTKRHFDIDISKLYKEAEKEKTEINNK